MHGEWILSTSHPFRLGFLKSHSTFYSFFIILSCLFFLDFSYFYYFSPMHVLNDFVQSLTNLVRDWTVTTSRTFATTILIMHFDGYYMHWNFEWCAKLHPVFYNRTASISASIKIHLKKKEFHFGWCVMILNHSSPNTIL